MSRGRLKGLFMCILYDLVQKSSRHHQAQQMWWSQDYIYDPRVQKYRFEKRKIKDEIKHNDIMWSCFESAHNIGLHYLEDLN